MTESAAYQEIVQNALAATGARSVVLGRFDPERQEASLVAWAGRHARQVERALAAMRRIVPAFDPTRIRVPVHANPWIKAAHLEGEPVSVPVHALGIGAVDGRIVRAVAGILGVRHVFLCPLTVGGRVEGTLSFHTAQVLTEAKRRVCAAFAQQAALTLENARLLTLERRHRRVAEGLHQAVLTIAAPVPAEAEAVVALLTAILGGVVAALGARSSWLALVDDTAWRDLLPGTGPTDGVLTLEHTRVRHRVRVSPDGATQHVLTTGELVQIPDTTVPTRFGSYPRQAQGGIGSFALLPLRSEGGILGALGVNFLLSGVLRAEDREVVTLFAAHAALALEQVRVAYAERRRAQQAEQLAVILAGVGAVSDLDAALEALLRGAISLLGGDDGSAVILGPATGDRRFGVHIGKDGAPEVQRTRAPQPPGSFGAALLAGGPPVLVEDFWALDSRTYPLYETMRRRGLRSAVNVAIDAGGRRIGTLNVNHHQPGFFRPTDLALAGALAAQAGAAIERARLETERQEALAAREAALRQLASRTEALTQREAEAAALRELDRLKNEFLATLSHELRTPLALVHGYAELLRARARSLDAAAVEAMATNLLTGSTQLVHLVDDLLDFARIERGEVRVHPIEMDLVPVLRDVLAALRREPGGERLQEELPQELPVMADPARVVQVLANLVANALKYAPEGPIAIRAGSADGAVRVEVEDRGPGIPLGEQPRVWERFYRGRGVAELNVARGTGIGLTVVKSLVEAQGGRVGLWSTPGQGARFWFALPAARA